MTKESFPSRAGEKVEKFVGKLATKPADPSDPSDVVSKGDYDITTRKGNVPPVDNLKVEVFKDPRDIPPGGNPEDAPPLSVITLSGAGTTVTEIHYDGEEVTTFAGDKIESKGVQAEVFADDTVSALEKLHSEGMINPNRENERGEA